ncbi:hypothetical protein ACFO0N_05415 [Halobium salinum]|uniref:Tripartite tricarboxylate transporter TctB family protein n=1 Tax=Halobium salinum TaxID=1364940 RepID=A0ABD5P9M6_9EURY|nr:hypothetical protein [Halobium salinum]
MDPVLLQAGEAGLLGPVVVFLISFVVGVVGIYVGAQLVIDRDVGWTRAAIAALVGALAWAVVLAFVGWIPLLGPILALLAWVGIINWSYPGGWGTAAAIGLIAWVVASVIIYFLGDLLGIGLSAFGIPGA